jgi:hypothetical protein
VREIRAVLVDRAGRLVWSDRQAPGDAAFDHAPPTCPMDGCVLLMKRPRPELGLADPFRSDAPKGRLAAKLEERSALPRQAEIDAIQARLTVLKSAGKDAVIKVLPARVGSDWSVDAARKLARLINERGLARATAVETPIPFAPVPGPNRQRTLWTGARSIQQAIKSGTQGTEWLMFVDCQMIDATHVGGVHTYVVTPEGALAIVDLQNAHHADFARIRPASVAGCCELAAVRLGGHLK